MPAIQFKFKKQIGKSALNRAVIALGEKSSDPKGTVSRVSGQTNLI